MPEYLTPGLYLEEVKDAPVVQGVSTSTGAFVGVTEKGPFGSTLVTSFREFVDKFGGFIEESYLAYAVKGFFDNGGSRAYISRVVHMSNGNRTSAPATTTITDAGAATIMTVDATSDGEWGNKIKVNVSNWSSSDKSFDFVVIYNEAEVEKYTHITLSEIEEAVNPVSKYVKVVVFDENANLTNGSYDLAGGDNGLVGLTGNDYIGDQQSKTGIYAFDNDPINMVAIPGVTDAVVLSELQTYCEKRSVFAIVETPSAKTPTQAQEFRMQTANLNSGRIAMYYPWIRVSDPIGVGQNPTKLVPPSGHIMGVYARTDANRGVFKAPAGETDGVIRGAVGLEYNVNDAEQALLNPIGVNCIRSVPGAGIVIWGARTQAPAGDVFQYVPVRRTVDYVEQSIINSTRWAVFEVNDETLWSRIKTSVEGFLRAFWRSGGLKGNTEEQAFIVKCDETTTTPEEIAQGKVFCEVAIATQKPAEFIVFRIQVR